MVPLYALSCDLALLASYAPRELISRCSLRHLKICFGNDLRVTDPLLHFARNTRCNVLSGSMTRNQFPFTQLMFRDTVYVC